MSIKIAPELTTTELQAAEAFVLVKLHQSLYQVLQKDMVVIRDKCCTLKQLVGNLSSELGRINKDVESFCLRWLKEYPEMIAHLEYYISAKSQRILQVLGKLNQQPYKPLVFPVTLVFPHAFVTHFWKRVLERVLIQCNKETTVDGVCTWIYSLSKDTLSEVLDQFTPLFIQMDTLPTLEKQKERHEQFVANYPLLLSFVQHRTEWFALQQNPPLPLSSSSPLPSQPDRGQLLMVARLDTIVQSLNRLLQHVEETEYETLVEDQEPEIEPEQQPQPLQQPHQHQPSHRGLPPPPPPSQQPYHPPLPEQSPAKEHKDETAHLLEKIKRMGEGHGKEGRGANQPLLIRTSESDQEGSEEEDDRRPSKYRDEEEAYEDEPREEKYTRRKRH